jgi:hypothetical protein
LGGPEIASFGAVVLFGLAVAIGSIADLRGVTPFKTVEIRANIARAKTEPLTDPERTQLAVADKLVHKRPRLVDDPGDAVDAVELLERRRLRWRVACWHVFQRAWPASAARQDFLAVKDAGKRRLLAGRARALRLEAGFKSQGAWANHLLRLGWREATTQMVQQIEAGERGLKYEELLFLSDAAGNNGDWFIKGVGIRGRAVVIEGVRALATGTGKLGTVSSASGGAGRTATDRP